MKFKSVNVSIDLPDTTTVHEAQKIEHELQSFAEALGLHGTVSFNTFGDFGKKPDAPKA